MKVLLIYKDYYPPVKGGIEGHLNLLATGLKKRGIDLDVLVSNTRARLEKAYIEGIPVTKVPQIGRFASAPLNMTFSFWIKKLGSEADLLHFHFPNPTAEISYLVSGLKKPTVVTYHSDIIRQARLLKLYTPMMKKFLEAAETIIVTSPNYLESSPFLKNFKKKCRLVPFGIELDDFMHPTDPQTIASIRRVHPPAILLFIGRFRYYKGLHVLIDAIQRVDAKLLLIGSGPLEISLRQHVRRRGVENKVVFLGELKDPEKIEYLHACDIFILPSVFRSEAFGIVQLEAMACAKPLICTELGTGTSYVNLHRETGLVVPPNDSKALARAIDCLLAHPELRNAYGSAGYARVQTSFSKDKMVDDIVSVYRDVLDRQPSLAKVFYPDAPADPAPRKEKIKVLRIISRLNIGGPAIHAYLLTKGLDPRYFETVLITGKKSAYEGDMSYLFDSLDNKPVIIDDLQRELSPIKDIKAFIAILKKIYSERPDIVHTHTTKAGASARFAVFLFRLLNKKKILTVHTFHGHVFTGYFNRFVSQGIIWIERFLMKLTDVVIAISDSQYRELTQKYRIAPSYKMVTKELGFNLSPFFDKHSKRGTFRHTLGISNETVLIGIIGRLVPIKNHQLFLQAAKRYVTHHPDIQVKFIIVGDGELRNRLERYAEELNIEDVVHFNGWVRDVSEVYSDLDILALTSLNEGTPVSVIEAMASKVPVISTDAGGVVDLLGADNGMQFKNGYKICERGILCRKDNANGFSEGLHYLMEMDGSEKSAMLERSSAFVRQKYTEERLIHNIETLYRNLILRVHQT